MLSGITALLRFGKARDGVSAVEFALIAPALVALLGGAVELSEAITAGNRATYVAETIGEVVSQARGPLSQNELDAFILSAAIIDPDIIDYAAAAQLRLQDAVDVTVSSVMFTPQIPTCTQNCIYDAQLVFSHSLSGPKRSCGKLDPATLPPEIYSLSPLVVVEVETFHRPIMHTILGEKIGFKRSAYFRPRHVEHVNYVNNCPGFPVS